MYFFRLYVFFASGALSWVQIPQGRVSWTFVCEWQVLFVLWGSKPSGCLLKKKRNSHLVFCKGSKSISSLLCVRKPPAHRFRAQVKNVFPKNSQDITDRTIIGPLVEDVKSIDFNGSISVLLLLFYLFKNKRSNLTAGRMQFFSDCVEGSWHGERGSWSYPGWCGDLWGVLWSLLSCLFQVKCLTFRQLHLGHRSSSLHLQARWCNLSCH